MRKTLPAFAPDSREKSRSSHTMNRRSQRTILSSKYNNRAIAVSIRTIGKPGGMIARIKSAAKRGFYKVSVDDIHTVLRIYKELVCTMYAHVCIAVISVNYYRTLGIFLFNWHRRLGKIRVNAISLTNQPGSISFKSWFHFSVTI